MKVVKTLMGSSVVHLVSAMRSLVLVSQDVLLLLLVPPFSIYLTS